MEEKKVLYYAPYSKYGFSVNVRDDKGNLVPLKDNQGNQRYYKGKPQWQTKYVEFNTIVGHRTNSTEPLCFFTVPMKKDGKDYKPVDADVYETLEKLADDPGTKVEREKDYKKRANPEAFAKEEELESVKAELAELKKSKGKKSKAVVDMMEEAEKLTEELKDSKAGKEADGDIFE